MQVQLGSYDCDSFDLLCMLMQQVQQQQCLDLVLVVLLVCLQVLLVCVVMVDFGFFVCDEYFVCELFNQIVEVGVNWLGDDDVDLQLLQCMVQSVQGLLGQDVWVLEVFVSVNEDVQQYQCVVVYCVELVECCYVEVVRGKEWLELVWCQVSVQIDQCCDVQELFCFVQILLCQVWVDVFILICLCYGDDLLQWQECLQQI